MSKLVDYNVKVGDRIIDSGGIDYRVVMFDKQKVTLAQVTPSPTEYMPVRVHKFTEWDELAQEFPISYIVEDTSWWNDVKHQRYSKSGKRWVKVKPQQSNVFSVGTIIQGTCKDDPDKIDYFVVTGLGSEQLGDGATRQMVRISDRKSQYYDLTFSKKLTHKQGFDTDFSCYNFEIVKGLTADDIIKASKG